MATAIQGQLPFGNLAANALEGSVTPENAGSRYAGSYLGSLGLNAQNYANILKGYQDTAAATTTADDAISRGYTQLGANVIQGLQGIQQAALTNIEDQYTAQAGKGVQSMISRGLGNTTLLDAMNRGLAADKAKATAQVYATQAKMIADYQSMIGREQLQALQQAAARGNQRAQAQLDFMERVTSKYPDAQQYARQAQMAGQARQAALDRNMMMARMGQNPFAQQQQQGPQGGGHRGGGGQQRGQGGFGGQQMNQPANQPQFANQGQRGNPQAQVQAQLANGGGLGGQGGFAGPGAGQVQQPGDIYGYGVGNLPPTGQQMPMNAGQQSAPNFDASLFNSVPGLFGYGNGSFSGGLGTGASGGNAGGSATGAGSITVPPTDTSSTGSNGSGDPTQVTIPDQSNSGGTLDYTGAGTGSDKQTGGGGDYGSMLTFDPTGFANYYTGANAPAGSELSYDMSNPPDYSQYANMDYSSYSGG